LQHLLQGFLVGLGQLALGDLVEAAGRLALVGGSAAVAADGKTQPEQGCRKTRRDIGRLLVKRKETEFRGRVRGPGDFLRGI
jgi:hypothetical protein